MSVRRVVTGVDPQGKAVIVADDTVPVVTSTAMPGAEFVPLWWFDSTPSLPLSGKEEPYTTFFPRAGGFRCGFITIPPAAGSADDAAATTAPPAPESEMLEGFLDVFEPDGSGMHTTASVDVDLLISGTLVLELDDGGEVALEPGDVVVQNGTRHGWRNRGSVPAVMAYFVLGAEAGPHGTA